MNRARARRPKLEPLLASERDALARVVARRGAWTSRGMRLHRFTLEAFLERGLVRKVGVLPDGTALYEATAEPERA